MSALWQTAAIVTFHNCNCKSESVKWNRNNLASVPDLGAKSWREGTNPNAFVGSISSFMGWFMVGMVWNSNACIVLLLELNSHFFDPNCSFCVSFHTLWDFARENFRNKPEIYIMISVVGLWNFSCTHSMIFILITRFSSSLILRIGTTPEWSYEACTTIRISSRGRVIIGTTLAHQNQLW